MKNIFIVVIVVIIAALGWYVLPHTDTPNTSNEHTQENDKGVATDYKNGSYEVDGTWVQLQNGISQVPILEGSASMVTTQYFGNEVRGDFDGDGDEDIAFILTQDGGGSGIFFYLVGAINEGTGYRGTPAVLIGDRVAPQTTEFRNLPAGQAGGTVIVNYADRKEGEAMAAVPSVGKSLYLKYNAQAGVFEEVAPGSM